MCTCWWPPASTPTASASCWVWRSPAPKTARAGRRSYGVARGLAGVQLVVSGAHRGLVEAIGAALPGAAWQRCRTHYLRNLLTTVPKSAQPWVATPWWDGRCRAVVYGG
ncbi:transposase [Nonomuraea terrae]|uniref:transposase n=1 Tax=Nonomuraea terrae TaxID=2530383 RepID=UPI003CCC6825